MKRALVGIVAGLLLVAAAIAGDNFNVLDKLNISFSTATVTGQLAPANGGSGVANTKNLTWSNSLTLAGTDATTMTFPATSATIARTDAVNTFTGLQTMGSYLLTGGSAPAATTTGISGINLSGAPRTTWIDSTRSANGRMVEWAWDTGTFYGQFVADNYGSGAQWIAAVGSSTAITSVTVKGPLIVSTGTTANQVRTAQTTVPTCTTNCGSGSPTVLGTDTAGIITLGTTPASGFQLNFNGTWATQGPACSVTPALNTMVVGKLPIAVVTTQTTMIVTTNGTAPATGDKYQYICVGVS